MLSSQYLPTIPKSNVIWNANFPEGTVCETTSWNVENTFIDLECHTQLVQSALLIPIPQVCKFES